MEALPRLRHRQPHGHPPAQSDLDAVGDAASETRALAQGLLADCSTRITYRQENDQLAGSATALGLTGTETSLLPTLGLGQGLWRIRDRAFLVAHQLTAGEAAVFDTNSRSPGNPSRRSAVVSETPAIVQVADDAYRRRP